MLRAVAAGCSEFASLAVPPVTTLPIMATRLLGPTVAPMISIAAAMARESSSPVALDVEAIGP